MSKTLRTILIIAGALAALVVGGGIALKLMFPPAKLRALIMPKIEQAVGRPVAVRDFSLTVWTGLGVKLAGIELANAKGFAERPMVKVESVTLKVNLLGLLKRQLMISSLIIDRPDVIIEKDKKGAFNFDDLIKAVPPESAAAASAPVPASPVSIALQSFRIKDGRFEFDDRQAKLRALATGIGQELSLTADQKMEKVRTTGRIEVREIAAFLPAMNVSHIKLNVKHDIGLDMPGKRVTINELTIAPQGIALTMAGTVDSFDTKPVLDLALKTTAIEVKKIFEAMPPEVKKQAGGVTASGLIELGLKISGQVDPKDPKSKPKVEGRVGLRNIGVKYALLPKAVSDVNGDIAFTENDLNIKSIRAKLGSAGFELACLVRNFEDPYVKVAFKGNFDLGEVKDYVPLEKGMDMSGAINADFKLEGLVRNVNSFNMDGKIDLVKLGFATPALMKPVTNISGTVRLTKNLVNIPDISCAIGKSSLSFTGQIKNFLSLVPAQPASPRLPRQGSGQAGSKQAPGQPALALPKQGQASFDFALTSPLLDLDEMLPPPPKPRAGPGVKGAAAAPPPMLALPDMLMDGNVRITKIKFMKMDFDNLAGNLTMKDRKVDLDGQVGVYSGKVLGNLWADLNDLNRIEYKLNADAQSLEANDFLSALTPFKDRLFAKLDLKGQFSGLAPDTVLVKQTLKGQGQAKTGEGKLVNWPLIADVLSHTKLGDTKEVSFKSLSMGFRILDQKLYLDDLVMNSKFGDVNLSGSSSFAGFLDYRVSIKLTKEESDKLKGKGGNVANLFADKDGRVVLDLLVKGQPPKPGISWDTQMAQARLKGKAQEEIDKAKADAEAKVKAEADKLKQQADAEADRLKKKADEEAKRAAEEAKKKLKNLFGH